MGIFLVIFAAEMEREILPTVPTFLRGGVSNPSFFFVFLGVSSPMLFLLLYEL
jgi:hypothetical protein